MPPQADIDISECEDVDLPIELFGSHRSEPFTYLADTQLLKIFSRSKPCKIFLAKADEVPVGCVYAMRYLYNCGYIGGLLVHKEFRRRGIGRRLLERALGFLETSYVYLFVEPENTAAKKLFESTGFNAIYRRLNCTFQTPLAQASSEQDGITYEVEWDELIGSLGFKERRGVVNLGYYPVRTTETTFGELKWRGNVLRCGDVIAIIEDSYNVSLEGYIFVFNDYVLRAVPVPVGKKTVEINPFYIRPGTSDLIKLVNHLVPRGEVVVWTYEGDPVASGLPRRGSLAPLVMELHRGSP